MEARLGALKHSVVTLQPVSNANAPVYHIALTNVPDFAIPSCSVAADLVVPSNEPPAGLPPDWARGLTSWLQRIALVDDTLTARQFTAIGYLALTPDGTLWDAYGARGPLSPDPAIGPRALERASERLRKSIDRAERRLQEVDSELSSTGIELDRVRRQLSRLAEIEERLLALSDELAEARDQVTWYAERVHTLTAYLSAQNVEKDNWIRQDTSLKEQLRALQLGLDTYRDLERMADQLAELDRWKTDRNDCWHSAENHRRRAGEHEAKAGDARAEAERWQGEAEDANRKSDEQLRAAEECLRKGTRLQQDLISLAERLTDAATRRHQVWDRHNITAAKLSPKPEEQWLLPDFSPDRIRDVMTRAESDLRLAESIDVPEDADQMYFAKAEAFRHKSEDLQRARSTYIDLRQKEQTYRDKFRGAVATYHEAMNAHFQTYLGRASLHGHIVLIPPAQMDAEEVEGKPALLGRGGYRWELHVARIGQPPRLVAPQIMRARARAATSDLSGGERAAVSLIHALAMLSCLNVKPPMYLLDEFDSALDESNRRNLFDLVFEVVGRKIITVSPRAIARDYLQRFAHYYCYIPDRVAGTSRVVRVSMDTFHQQAGRVRSEEGAIG